MRATAERVLARSWVLVAIVAILGALPLIGLGELSASDTRDRARADALRLTEAVAARAADLLVARVVAVRDRLIRIAATPPGNELVASSTGILELLAQDRPLLGTDVTRLMFVANGTPIAGTPQRTLVSDPAQGGAIAKAFAEQQNAEALRTAGNVSPGDQFLAYSGVYMSGPESPALTIAASSTYHGVAALRTFAAEIDLSGFGVSLRPLLATATDVYVIDPGGRLIARATTSVASTSRSGAGIELLRLAVPADGFAGEADDPIAGSRRLIAAAYVPQIQSTVVVVRPADVAEREIGPALDQARIWRIALAAIFLIGAYLFARLLSAAIRRRVALTESLEQNVRLFGELRATNVALTEATEAKSRFFASVSHELRTPLNAILGFSDALVTGVDGPLNDEQKASLGFVQNGARDLLSLVNDLLDLSKIEAQRISLASAPLAPVQVADLVLTQLRPLAAQHGTHLYWIDDGAPLLITADAARLRQILTNLVGNALKFAKGGEVEITISRKDAHVQFAVRDTGRGVGLSERDAIFEEFRQARPDDPGTGLGLPISRRLARLMGGDITLQSEEGKGSTFTLVLPLEAELPV